MPEFPNNPDDVATSMINEAAYPGVLANLDFPLDNSEPEPAPINPEYVGGISTTGDEWEDDSESNIPDSYSTWGNVEIVNAPTPEIAIQALRDADFDIGYEFGDKYISFMPETINDNTSDFTLAMKEFPGLDKVTAVCIYYIRHRDENARELYLTGTME
jgi:hypothetical protein